MVNSKQGVWGWKASVPYLMILWLRPNYGELALGKLGKGKLPLAEERSVVKRIVLYTGKY